MTLEVALDLVWDDVADSVYRNPSLAEAFEYVRTTMTANELRLVAEFPHDPERPDTRELIQAYALVIMASERELWVTRWRVLQTRGQELDH